MPAPPAPPAPLEYGLSPPRRRRHIVQALVAVALLIIAYGGYRWGGYIWSQAAILNAQRQCLRYTAPPDRVVYEENPPEVTRLLARGGDYVRYPLNRAHPFDTPRKSSAATATFPACWSRFTQLVSLKNPRPGQAFGAVLFLHERSTPSGQRRLVCIRHFPETHSFTPQFIDEYNIEQAVFTPGTWASSPSQALFPTVINVISSFPDRPPNVRIYAGQIDPNDDSRFTIRYEMWGQTDILDGRLMENDQVVLTPRQIPQPPSR
jgi:hypothetical protein